ncbi:hypothetical protein WOB65_22925 [Vibrio parahaemolyticus]|nr:hypothetical protein [Vibrio parahaemolyticus]HCH6158861.1 hypothetical protein [Vibrio parahaemolyticus]
MQNWILQNKDWLFSGAGIFVVTTVFSIISIIVTLVLKSRTDKKARKKLQILEDLVKFELPNADEQFDSKALSVSYKNESYKHLCHYSVSLKNTGSVAIEKQNLLLSIPEAGKIIERNAKACHSSIEIKEQPTSLENDKLYVIDRLEADEEISITLLVNVEDSHLIECTPRGVDGIDYVKNKPTSSNDMEVLIFLLAVFIMVDMVPFVGSGLQALVVVVSSPRLIKIGLSLLNSQKNRDNVINISGGIRMAEDSNISIEQQRRS